MNSAKLSNWTAHAVFLALLVPATRPSDAVVVEVSTTPSHGAFQPSEGAIRLIGPGGERAATRSRDSARTWTCDDVPQGGYTLRIDDPRFEPWEKSGVGPGETVLAQLVGGGALHLDVRSSDGSKLERYQLSARFHTSAPDHEFVLHSVDDAPPVDGVHRVPSGEDFDIVVTAPHHYPLRAAVQAIASMERHAMRIDVEPCGGIRGRVIGFEPRELEWTTVVLEREAPPTLEERQRGPMGWGPFARRATVDEHDEFEFDELPAGHYRVTACVHSYLTISAELDVVAGRDAQVELIAPPTGSIAGHASYMGAPFGGATVEAISTTDDPGERYHWVQPPDSLAKDSATPWPALEGVAQYMNESSRPSARVLSDGSFEIQRLKPGDYRVVLNVVRSRSRDLFGDARDRRPDEPDWRVSNAMVTVRADEATNVDLSELLPPLYALQVIVTLDGGPPDAVECILLARGAQADAGKRRLSFLLRRSGELIHRQDAPGKYLVRITSPDRTWSFDDAEPLSVTPGTPPPRRIDIRRRAGVLRILDAANDAPLANHVVAWHCGDGWTRLRTYDSGELTLNLPSGAYAIADCGLAPSATGSGPTTAVEWTSIGPASLDVRVAPARRR